LVFVSRICPTPKPDEGNVCSTNLKSFYTVSPIKNIFKDILIVVEIAPS